MSESDGDRASTDAWAPRLDDLTCSDYHVVMKGLGIAELKAHLSEHLRSVRKGRSIVVLDRDTPVARIVPIAVDPLEVRRATRRATDLKVAVPVSGRTDSLAVLLDDRRRR